MTPRPQSLNTFYDNAKYHLKQAIKLAINHRGQRGSVFREELFDFIARWSPALAVESDGIRYYVSTKDRGLSRIVFSDGSYEEDIMASCIQLIERYSGRQQLLAGRTFVDVGANIGTSTVPALVRFGAADAIAFEPDPQNYKLLRCNAIANDVDQHLRTFQVALSDSTGTGLLERAEASWSDHRVRLRSDISDGPYQESLRPTVEVSVARFDDLVREIPIDLAQVGLVWMDTQGHEAHILAGASSLLATAIPVVIEYWPYGLRRVDGLDLLHGLVASHYRRVIDVRASIRNDRLVDFPAASLHELVHSYDGDSNYTDLVLLS